MPRTKSCRFLSNIRSMLPFTIFRAMMISLLSYRTEPQTRALSEYWPARRSASLSFSPEQRPVQEGFCSFCKCWSAADPSRKWLTKWRTDHLTDKPIHTASVRRDATLPSVTFIRIFTFPSWCCGECLLESRINLINFIITLAKFHVA